jgi:hypothetical protein
VITPTQRVVGLKRGSSDAPVRVAGERGERRSQRLELAQAIGEQAASQTRSRAAANREDSVELSELVVAEPDFQDVGAAHRPRWYVSAGGTSFATFFRDFLRARVSSAVTATQQGVGPHPSRLHLRCVTDDVKRSNAI